MQIARKIIVKIIAISVISAVLDVILHAFLAPTYNYDYPPSYFVQSGLVKPAAAISLLIIFFLLGVVFMYIQEYLPGGKKSKGTRFGVSFGGLWLLGVIGMSIFFGSPLSHEFVGGACDCVSIIVLGVLLGAFAATDSPCRSEGRPARIISALVIITVFFIIGQYLAFVLMSDTPYLDISGLSTFVWTAVLGLWAGVVYWLLRDGIGQEKSLIWRAIYFGGFIIGIDWVLFNLFVLLFVAVPVLDPIILAVLNIVSIMIGLLVYEALFEKRNAGYPDNAS